MGLSPAVVRVVPHPRADVYAVVADVARYPAFVPGCISATMVATIDNRTHFEVTIGWRGVGARVLGNRLRHHLTCVVTADPGHQLTIRPGSGPFRHVTAFWTFADKSGAAGRATVVGFLARLDRDAPLLARGQTRLLHQAAKTLLGRFDQRLTGQAVADGR